MPTILIGTLAEDGSTTYGTYSLCFPFYIAGKDYYAMKLNCRNSSNTCNRLTNPHGAHFILKIDKILLKERYHKAIIKGVNAKAVDVESVLYAANRIDPRVKFTSETPATMTKVPRIFINKALKWCVDWTIKHNVNELKPEHMARIRNKHDEE